MANVTIPVYITHFTSNSFSASESNICYMEKYLTCFALKNTVVSVFALYSDTFSFVSVSCMDDMAPTRSVCGPSGPSVHIY